MRMSDWSSVVCSSDRRETEPGGIAATATDNFQVVPGQRIVTCNLALIERRVIMPRPDFQAHQSPPRQASSPSLCLSVRRSSGGQDESVRQLWTRSDECSVGKECVSTGTYRWPPDQIKKN